MNVRFNPSAILNSIRPFVRCMPHTVSALSATVNRFVRTTYDGLFPFLCLLYPSSVRTMLTMKKTARVEMRLTQEQWSAFSSACSCSGLTVSFVVRELCKAVVPYLTQYCVHGTWYPPQLIPALPGATANAPVRQAADKPSDPPYGTPGKRRP